MAAAFESCEMDRLARKSAKRSRDFGRLIVTASPQPQRMQRHRQNKIALRQQAASASFKPARESGCEIEPVGVFQGEDRTPALIVVAHDGARLVVGGWACQARRAARVAPRVEFEWQTATFAHRAIEKLDFLPALRAEGTRIGNLHAARHAKRRKDKIDQRQNIRSIPLRICPILAQWPMDRRAFSTATP